METYTALLTGNRRDIYSSPKALLTNVKHLDGTTFRDHCWVQLSQCITDKQPPGHRPPIPIKFQANIKEYLAKGITPSLTLVGVQNLTKLRRLK